MVPLSTTLTSTATVSIHLLITQFSTTLISTAPISYMDIGAVDMLLLSSQRH
jgi:hypothetical protein